MFDDQPITVTNLGGEDAPPDLVVLTVQPPELTTYGVTSVLCMEWYAPDPAVHPVHKDTILVRWDDLQDHQKTPEAPADHGLDNLKAVVKVAAPNQRADDVKFYIHR